MYRHGDVLLKKVKEIPANAKPIKGSILMRGEVTGHSHRIAEAGACELFTVNGEMYMNILSDSATLVHEEHKAIELTRGSYLVWQQREYTPREIRRVVD